ncbi:MAG: molecular chaperone HtpG [Alphaproteobacteria bacterium]|nr:molecular chaperone HtpG [Alphaproteobacteria bacterium]
MSAQQHGFKAEVQQLLDLMIHAVYSNRDVFLRELVSNAADALDKVRFLGLTHDDLVPAGHDPAGIRLEIDAEARTLVVEDDGVGMTLDEAVENLGTIAHSGTKAFLARAKEGGGDLPKLIGQFGVGFYACFMVAEQVVVESRSASGGPGVRWSSKGDGTYEVEEADKEHRGTRITLTLREDAAEYAEEATLRRIVREHSAYLAWPILLGDATINTARAIWALQPSEVTDEEANAFYRMQTFDFEDPLLRVHFHVDTPLQYSVLLFVPRARPFDLYHPDAAKGPRLYARRVLIEEHASSLLPDWLRFVRGVVDSEDIPLNVSREMVQKTPIVRSIRDALVKRLLKELGRLADQDAPEEGEHPYTTFWKAFGALLKEGYFHERTSLGDRLLPLLRFGTVQQGDALVSLDAYRKAMPLGQDTIWYLTAPSREAALASPHLEAFRKKGWDVLVLTDPVDEWFVQALTEVDDVPVKAISRGELELDEDEADEAAPKADLSELAPWLQELYGGAVHAVRPSSRLTDSPAVLVDAEDGVSAHMERILRQANQEVPAAKRSLELNVKHPLIVDLATLHARGAGAEAETIARLILDEAKLLDGSHEDPTGVGRRLQDLLQRAARQWAETPPPA